MLILTISEPWFSMIVSGEKKEEYRDIKPFYTTRFKNVGLLNDEYNCTDKEVEILFRNGYDRNKPYFCAKITISKGRGRRTWGAASNKLYYVLKINKLTEICINEKKYG